jgi:tape measure domain-containing protein
MADVPVRFVADTSSIDRAAGQLDKVGSSISSGFKKVGDVVATSFTIGAGAVAGFSAAVVTSGKSYNVLAQTSQAAFKTILGSADAATQMMSDLAGFAKTSPFPRQNFIEATQQMLAFGFAAKDVIPTLDAIQNAVAATGGSATQINEIADILSKVQSTGKITAETLNQLGYRGIDAAKLIGQGMGETAQQIRDDITNGTLDAQTALQTLTDQMAVTYAGAAANVKNTWAGATDRVKGAMRDIGSAIVEPFISKAGGGLALEWANKFADLLRKLEPLVTPIVNAVLNVLGPALSKVSPFLDSLIAKVGDFAAGGAQSISNLFGALKDLAPVLAPIVGMLLKTGGANLASAFGPLGGIVSGVTSAFGPLGSTVAALLVTMPDLRGVIGDVFDVLKGLMGPIGDVVKSLAGALKPVLAAIVPVLGKLGTTIATAFVKLAPFVVQLVDAFTPLLPVIGELATVLIQDLLPALMPILPVFVKLAEILSIGLVYAINAVIAPLTWMSDWMTQNQTLAQSIAIGLGAIGAVILAMLVPAFLAWAAGALAAAAATLLAIAPFVVIGAAVAALAYLIITNWDTIKSATAAVWDFIVGAFHAVVDFLKQVPGWIADIFKGLFDILTWPYRTAWDFIVNLWNGAKEFFGKIPGWIADALSTVWDVITSPFQRAWDWIKTWVIDPIKTEFQGAIDLIKSGFNGVARFWNSTVGSLSFEIPSWVPGIGGKGFDVPDIPLLDTGGIVTRPTLALLAANSRPEAVIPLSGPGSPVRTGPVVHIEQAVFTDQTDIDLFMARVAWAAQTERV